MCPAPKGNKFAIGNSGKPPLYKTAKELEIKCSEYFQECHDSKIKITITGLALYLGFCSRQSIYDYEEKEEFAYTIKRAKLAVENSYEISGNTIDIFALKNMGWYDKIESNIKIQSIELSKDQIESINKDLNDEI